MARPVCGLAAILLLWLAQGCGRPSDARPGTIELTIWTGWEGTEEIGFRRVLHRYEQLHPNIHFHNLGAVNDDTKTVRAIVAGVPPDIFALWDPAYLGPFAQNRAIRPLEDFFRQSGLREADFLPAALGMSRYRGVLYAMPFLLDVNVLYWNKQAFAEAGLDPNRPPQTLEELADYAVRLTKRDPDGTITRLGLQNPGDAGAAGQLCALYGGQWADPMAGRITTDDPANVAALTWYKNLVEREGGIRQVNAFSAGLGQAQGANNPFYVGKVAMMFSGEYNPYWISRYAPQLQYDIAPIPPPAAHPENANTVMFGINDFCISAGSKHPKEAWDFLVWMQSYEAQVMFARALNNIPNMRAVLHAPELREGAPYRHKFGYLMDLAAKAKPAYFPALPVTSYYESQWVNAMDVVVYGEKTPAQALADVRRRVQKEMEQQ